MPVHSPGNSRFAHTGYNSAGDRMFSRVVLGSEQLKDLAYYDMTKDELQEELEKRGLPKSGNKDELIQRLQESD